jgi:hypothetical protein
MLTMSGSTINAGSSTSRSYNGVGDGGGGAIFNSGTFILHSSTITGNSSRGGDAGAIYNSGTLHAYGSTIENNNAFANGGGILNRGGTVTLYGMYIVGNSASIYNGGGIFSSGTLTVTNSTIAQNSAGNEGGGIDNSGTLTVSGSTITGDSAAAGGGGIDNSGTLTVNDNTITGDSVTNGSGAGGIENGTGKLTLVGDTITANSGNSGGLWIVPRSSATLNNTIVAGNLTAGSGSAAKDIVGSVTTAGSSNNLIGTGGSGGLANGDNGNFVGVANPGLGSLGNYGGTTETIPLLLGSPAIDAGSNAANSASVDQRGDARVYDGTVDIGAFESQGFTLAPLAGSTPQTTAPGAAFAHPLGVTVTSNDGVLPVAGGTVHFTVNTASDGAAATLSAVSATIGSNGQASVTATANGKAGSYIVTASATGVPTPATFDLANLAPPTANAQSDNVAHDTAKAITLTGSDPAGQPLTYALVTQPAHGTLSGFNSTTGAVIYTPTAGYHGTDTFTFSDGIYTSAAATVTLAVTVGTPTAVAQSVGVAFNTAKGITLTGTDPDSPALSLTYTLATQPTHGTLTGTAPNLTYTPTAGYHGSDSFTFTVNNGTNTSSPATVTLTVAAGTPTANAQTVAVSHDSTKVPITLSATDDDTPALTLTYSFTQPAHGTVSVSGSSGSPTVVYTPAAGYHGADSFTFTTSNGTNTSAPATMTLNVAVGTPTAAAQTVGVPFDSTGKPITLTSTDDDSPALTITYSIATGPSHGSLSNFNASTGAVTYTPAAGYQGPDSFIFTASNGTNTSPAATVTLNVAAAGTPTANSQTDPVAHDSTGTAITLTGTDPDSPPLPLTYAFTQPSHGTVAVSG